MQKMKNTGVGYFKVGLAWFGATVLAIIFIIALTFGGRMLEYVSFKYSPQTMISEEHRVNTLQAELARVDTILRSDPLNTELQAQKAFLEVQINSRKD